MKFKITHLRIQLLFVCFLLLSGFNSTAQINIDNQTFTTGSLPSGWSQTDVTFSTSASGYANFTTTSAVLTSPVYDLTNYTSVTLSFDVAKFGSGTDGPITVQISNDGGTTWTAQTFNSLTPTGSTYVSTVNQPITVTGSSVRIRFVRTNSPSQKRFKNLVLKGVVQTSTPFISYNDDNIVSGFGFQDVLTYSASKSFLVSGTNLTNNIIATSPSVNFELSLDDSTWSSTVSIAPSANTVTNVPVYVRFYPQSAGTKSANISLASTGAVGDFVSVVGTGVVPQLTAPVATAATTITATSFVANWNAVSGVTNYAIDVSTSPTFTESNGFTTDLIISEYIEGSSNNKYIEIFNGTGSDVDLSDYELQLFSNGSSSASISNVLSGVLATSSSKVYKNSSATAYSGTSTDASAVGFNGDDAIALYKVSTSAFVDIFGVIGVDPGSSWDDGAISTSNQTLVRNSNVFSGVTTNPSSFDTLGTQWTSYAIDDVTHLGNHSFDGGLTPSFVFGYDNQSTGNATSIMVTGLTQGTTYYYRVRAVGVNTSENSNVISLTTDLTSVTWNGTAWSNVSGPTSSLEAVIEGVYNTNVNGAFNAKKIIINSGSLIISSNTTIETQDNLVNNLTAAAVVVENDGVLKQINNVANTGDITVKRNSADMLRLDYTAWSSPVVGQNILAFSPATLTNRFYEYNPTTNAYSSVVPSTTNFTSGKGLLVRAPNTWSSTTPTAYPGTFTGVPNNGNITTAIQVGFNLIGNPYSSPISASSYLGNANNNGLGMTTLYFWTHTLAADGSGNYTTNNYATHNGTVGVAAAAGGAIPDGNIQVGQGFIVNATANGSAQFNNGMRLSTSGGQFFKTSGVVSQPTTIEKHGMWFDLTSTGNSHNQIYVGYIQGATNAFDNSFDSPLFGQTSSALYSPISNEKFVIQARALPFSSSDVVPLGLVVATAGQFTISLNSFNGIFTGQDVYLRDNLLNVTHDIKGSSYTFASDAGEFGSRFEIVYASPLVVETPTFNENSVVVYNNESGININAGQTLIESVKVFDVRGRLLITKSNVNTNSITLEKVTNVNQVLIVQVTSDEGITVSKKVIN